MAGRQAIWTQKETHAARWGLLRGFSIYCNEVGGLRYGRLNPKGVLPPDKDSHTSLWSQDLFSEFSSGPLENFPSGEPFHKVIDNRCLV